MITQDIYFIHLYYMQYPKRYLFTSVFGSLTFMSLTLWLWVTTCKLSSASDCTDTIHPASISNITSSLRFSYFNVMYIILFLPIYISLIWYTNQNLIIYIFNALRFKSDPWCCHCKHTNIFWLQSYALPSSWLSSCAQS